MEYAERWINTVVPVTCKSSTEKDYQIILSKYVLPVFGTMPVTEINRLDLKEFLMGKIKDGLSPSTVNHYKNCISGVFNLAVDDGLIYNNPAHRLGKLFNMRKIQQSKRQSLKIDFLTRKELSLFLDTFKKHFPEQYPLCLTLSRTGMRIGEALALKWTDINFNGRLITVQRGISRGKIETPKSGKKRRVDMSLQLTETLWKLKRERQRLYVDDMSEWVFPNADGNTIDTHNWRHRVFQKALEKSDMRRIRIHDLRHTYASLLLQAGESMAYIRDQLGHHSIKVTVDIYGHLVPGGNKEAVDRLDDIIESAPIRTLYAP